MRQLSNLFLAFIPLAAVCTALAQEKPMQAPRSVEKSLSREEADRRSKAVQEVRYDLALQLSDQDKTVDFTGQVAVNLEIIDDSVPLTLDFAKGNVRELSIDGKKESKIDYNGLFVSLPKLKKGTHAIVLTFSHPYSTNGDGLYRFKDPEDGRVYLYTNFEPFDANLLFPMFDQPDIKATFKLTVEAPKDWTVVSSVREVQPPKTQGKIKTWKFPESARFSTYLFSLIAGPYKIWEDKAGDVPLRLLARQSLAKFVPVADWFKITKQGLRFYDDYFAYPYPFKKYDQVIVPDFNAGAMENVANVTFSERFVPRGAETSSDRESRAGVILHEMAHMWFGDLVTMKWWNDLWLNESFATYMATLAATEATEFKRAWQTFYTDTKQWAYWEDQLVTTHPIEGLVPNTDQAFANFDGITYGKGAASQKALSYFIGADAFRDGVRQYFKNHAYQNAELKDFMGALSAASGKDLSGWTNEWLRTAGLNTVAATYECSNGKTSRFALKQTAPADQPTLRTHRSKIGLFRKDAEGKINLQKSFEITYQGESTLVPELDGVACPDLVYPNHEDFDFVKVRLDERTLDSVKANLSSVADPLVRAMYWTSLWEMVRDGEWPATAFADAVFKHVALETDDKILEKVLELLIGRRRTTASVATYITPRSAAASAFAAQAETFAWDNLSKASAGSDKQKLWFNAFVRLARSSEALDKLEQFLAGKVAFKGLLMDQDRRWLLVQQLAESGSQHAQKARVNELKRDASSRGVQAAITAEVLQPNQEVKASWYAKLTSDETKMPLAQMRAAMSAMYPANQLEFKEKFAAAYFKDLPALVAKRDHEFADRFADSLAPGYCTEQSTKALEEFIASHRDLPAFAMKGVKVAAQEDGRCVRARKVAATASDKAH